jgi:PadR family transcriptional regulator PadR
MPIDRELLKGSTATLVLSLLSRAPMHGYQMARELERQSEGVLTFKDSTLYPILHNFEAAGMITAEWRVEGGRDRKVYSLTESGQDELRRRAAEWQSFRGAVDQVIKGVLIGDSL